MHHEKQEDNTDLAESEGREQITASCYVSIRTPPEEKALNNQEGATFPVNLRARQLPNGGRLALARYDLRTLGALLLLPQLMFTVTPTRGVEYMARQKVEHNPYACTAGRPLESVLP